MTALLKILLSVMAMMSGGNVFQSFTVWGKYEYLKQSLFAENSW